MSPDWKTTKVRHGTPSGYTIHQKLGEQPCNPCYQAKREYDQRRREATPAGANGRIAARAQGRAESELARRHRDEYRELYAKFLAELKVGAP